MRLKRRKKSGRHSVRGGTTRLINPELAGEREQSRISNNGILRQETYDLQLPDALAEAGDNSPSRLLPGPIVTTILIVAVILISIVAWLVSRMPE
ncbi:MAG: hypothetical protein AB7H86_02260 [Blastocatellales bacterium]